jgi:hypothetical protein
LVPTYVLINQSHFNETPNYTLFGEPLEDEFSKASLMASMQDQIYKEMEVTGLAKFTAYCNKVVKVVFEDRTIVRMMQGCESARILTRLGEEIILNLYLPKPQYSEQFSLI